MQGDWDRAGLMEERHLASTPIEIPAIIDLQEDRLVWSMSRRVGDELHTSSRRFVDSATLEQFVGLTREGSERILEFARRWGVLDICKHNLPASHNPPTHPLPSDWSTPPWCTPLGNENSYSTGWEPLSVWRDLSAQFRAILNIRACLEGDKTGKPEDWRIAVCNESAPYWDQTLESDHDRLAIRVNEFLKMGAVAPFVQWFDYDRRQKGLPIQGWAIKLKFGGLFGALAAELAFAVARTDGLAICSACAKSYTPRRRPAAGRRQYCDGCKKASRRDARRDCTRRKKLRQEM